MEAIEVERKFLLKKYPEEFLREHTEKKTEMVSYYFSENRRITRYTIIGSEKPRFDLITKSDTSDPKARREKIDRGIDDAIAIDMIKREAKRKISKIRYEFSYENQKWEVDRYIDIDLNVAECEQLLDVSKIEKTDQILKYIDIPEVIEDNLIVEVTEIPEFRNYHLALSYND